VTRSTPAPRARPRGSRLLRVAIAAGFLAATISCGASIQAVYEGDVRFEHCMSVDAQPDVKPAIPSTCWEEWLKFYTFGQTLDRIEHARARVKQLSASSDFTEAEWKAQNPSKPAAVPDPTSVAAPPPMLLTVDGGARDGGPADSGADADAAVVLPGADCAGECQQGYAVCRKECKTDACEKACVTKYKRCMKRCF
jgi:hypothetical protein